MENHRRALEEACEVLIAEALLHANLLNGYAMEKYPVISEMLEQGPQQCAEIVLVMAKRFPSPHCDRPLDSKSQEFKDLCLDWGDHRTTLRVVQDYLEIMPNPGPVS